MSSGLGPAEGLPEQGVEGHMGVSAPPWVGVTCEGGFSCQGAAEGQGAGGPPLPVGPVGCAVLGVAPLLSRAVQGKGAGQRVAPST